MFWITAVFHCYSVNRFNVSRFDQENYSDLETNTNLYMVNVSLHNKLDISCYCVESTILRENGIVSFIFILCLPKRKVFKWYLLIYFCRESYEKKRREIRCEALRSILSVFPTCLINSVIRDHKCI